MNVEELKSFCRGYAGATEVLHGAPTNVLAYAVGGKNFAYFKTSEPEKWRFSTRVSADRFVELTDIPGVKPARYMGRFHWVTIVEVEQKGRGTYLTVGSPIKFSSFQPDIKGAPLLGEHSDEVLAELGYDGPAIAALRDAKVIL